MSPDAVAPGPPAIVARDLEKRVDDGGERRTILRGVSLEVERGERICLAGESGAGKTTLLAILGGMLLPTSGEVLLDGEPVTRLRDHHRALVRRRTVGYVFQDFALVPELSCLDNVTLPGVPEGLDLRSRGEELLASLGLEGRGGAPAGRLSGGEQQRVAIARALVMKPKVLLLDEPTAHLDDARAGALLEALERLADGGLAVVAASHDARVLRAAARVVTLADGVLS